MTLSSISPVLVVGTGLMGTSIALSLRRAGIEVLLDDPDATALETAVDMRAGRRIESADLPRVVVVAVPPSYAPRVLAQASRDYPLATITDVTSVKESVLRGAIDLGADADRLIGGHPMAGRETSGPRGARADLLDDRVWILTPGENVDADRLLHVHRLVTACGAYAVEMSPREHDAAVALVSHAPQLVASALAGSLAHARDEDVRISGQGLRDTTRIAGSQSDLWVQILTENAGPVADIVDEVAAHLSQAARALRVLAQDRDDHAATATIEGILREGALGQARIPGKHGAKATIYTEVEVMVADRPGELARLFMAAGDGGVNLEDVRIEHVLGRPSGLVGLFVQPDAADRLREELRARDFDVRS